MRPMTRPATTAAGVDAEPDVQMGAEPDDVPLGGRVWALRCAGVLCEAPSPDRPDHPAPCVGYMRADIKGREEPWPF